MIRQEFIRHGDFIHLIYGKPAVNRAPEIVQIIDIINDYDEGNIPLLTRYLTSGSMAARNNIRTYLMEVISHFQNAFDTDHYDQGGEYLSYEGQMAAAEERWDIAIERYDHPILANTVKQLWNMTHVLAETGYECSYSDAAESGKMTLGVLLEEFPNKDALPDDTYYRGIAAVLVAKIKRDVTARMHDVHIRGFLGWAGSHEDLTQVIDAVCERNTFDCRTLHAVMLEQEDKAALQSGVL